MCVSNASASIRHLHERSAACSGHRRLERKDWTGRPRGHEVRVTPLGITYVLLIILPTRGYEISLTSSLTSCFKSVTQFSTSVSVSSK